MKRRLLTITMFLLLGAIVNVAVAWGSAIFGPLAQPEWFGFIDKTESRVASLPQHAGKAWALSRWRAFGRTEAHYHLVVPMSTGCGQDPAKEFLYDLVEHLEKHDGRVVDLIGRRVIQSADDYCHTIEVAEYGLPLAALSWRCERSEYSWGRYNRTDFRHSIPVEKTGDPAVRPRVLPILPMWPGFTVNTLFYAMILWMMFVIPGVLRRKRRLARGLCPACAYPVGVSDICTECGKPLSKRGRGVDQA